MEYKLHCTTIKKQQGQDYDTSELHPNTCTRKAENEAVPIANTKSHISILQEMAIAA